ncbi:hypothetical protein V1477_012203 [Vespula maculifrons]|uniref:Uncharacterized protein n=1 Tax=Vespula maculifrons TaxID=7453 RepID=A0ABD2BWT7_VESMC
MADKRDFGFIIGSVIKIQRRIFPFDIFFMKKWKEFTVKRCDIITFCTLSIETGTVAYFINL